MRRIPFVILAVCATVLLSQPSPAEASDTLFRYKFPCIPEDACHVTRLTHVNNSYDFDPRGGYAGCGAPCLGDIIAVSEGTFVAYHTDADSCTTSGIGMWLRSTTFTDAR
jgi:hypothetical protein